MAQETGIGLADKARFGLVFLVKRVKHGAQLRIDSANFQHRTRLAITDVDMVAEIQGSGRGRLNPVALHARFRKYQRLRRGCHPKLQEEGTQVALSGVIFQVDLARIEPFLQVRNHVVGESGGIVDRRPLIFIGAQPRRPDHCQGAAQNEAETGPTSQDVCHAG